MDDDQFNKLCGEVVVGHLNVDNVLGFVISHHFLGAYTIQFGEILHELSYSKKCKVLRSLKRPPKDINRDLERLGAIRNAIAHRLVTFKGPHPDAKPRLVDHRNLDSDFDVEAHVEEFHECFKRVSSYLLTFIEGHVLPSDEDVS